MGEISRGGYNPDKSRDGSGSGWDEKISSILTLHQDQGCCPRLFLMLLGQFPRILRESAWKNLGQSRLSPIFPDGLDGLGSSISTQLRDRGGYPIPISIFVEIGEGHPDSSRPCLLQAPEACVTLAWFWWHGTLGQFYCVIGRLSLWLHNTRNVLVVPF